MRERATFQTDYPDRLVLFAIFSQDKYLRRKPHPDVRLRLGTILDVWAPFWAGALAKSAREGFHV